jgi:hypothetical protein
MNPGTRRLVPRKKPAAARKTNAAMKLPVPETGSLLAPIQLRCIDGVLIEQKCPSPKAARPTIIGAKEARTPTVSIPARPAPKRLIFGSRAATGRYILDLRGAVPASLDSARLSIGMG